VIITLCILQTN